jgi:hypothetical protein
MMELSMAFRSLALALVLGLPVAACATVAEEAEDDTALAEALAGFERTGETVSCLSTRQIDDINPINDENWLITTRDGDTYLNTVSGGCFNADSPFTYLAYRTTGSRLCRGDVVRVMNSSSRSVQGSCALGEYEELRPIE